MAEELKDPIADLLIQLANSLNDRCHVTIAFSDKERKIVTDWIVKIGDQIESQQKCLPNCS